MPGHAYRLTTIPRGLAGTRTTLEAMDRLVRSGVQDPSVVLYAQQIVRSAPEYGQRAELSSILDDVRRTMRYTLDPLGVETVKSPSFVLEEIRTRGKAAMDCDDATVWTAALVRSVGMQTRFRVIRDDPREYTHVYLEALADGAWVPLDPIARSLPAGRAPAGVFGSAVYEGGRMFRGMGQVSTVQAPSLMEQGESLLDAYLDVQKERLKKKLEPKASKQVIRQPAEMAPPIQAAPFPWGKVLLVAGIGVGAIVALRMMKKRR